MPLALLCDRLPRERQDCKRSVRCQAMPRILAGCHEAVARTARCIFPLAAKAGDEPTADLLTQQPTAQEPTAWILSSHRQA
ncbi:MAG: starvation/stationary phase protection protein [Proteobacteria bacterium]|nr:starvation/stationary phase protection protein [Pseudomonadota bacterium]